MKVTINYSKFESVFVINVINTCFEELPVPGFVLGFDPNSYSADIYHYLKTGKFEDKNQNLTNFFHVIYEEIRGLFDCKIKQKLNYTDCDRALNQQIVIYTGHGLITRSKKFIEDYTQI